MLRLPKRRSRTSDDPRRPTATMTVAQPTADTMTLSSELLQQYRENGFVVAPGVFSQVYSQQLGDLVSRLAQAEQALLPASLKPGRHGPTERSTVEVALDGTIAWQLNRPILNFAEHRQFHAAATQPSMVRIATQLLGGTPAIFADQAFLKPPAVGGPKALHQDNWYFMLASSGDVCTAWIALDHADERNGALRYRKGSHLAGIVPHSASDQQTTAFGADYLQQQEQPTAAQTSAWSTCWPTLAQQSVAVTVHDADVAEAYQRRHLSGNPMEELVAAVPQGGVVFHHGATLHCSHANTSQGRQRRAYAVHYVRATAPFWADAPARLAGLPLGRLLLAKAGSEDESDLEPCVVPVAMRSESTGPRL